MPLYSLENHHLALTVSPCGGSILQLLAKRADGNVHLLRPSVLSEKTPAAESACFPLLPFGNRLKGNAFDFEGRHYTLPSNTGDAHYLHGDGWLGNWECTFQNEDALTLAFTHRSDSYCYCAEQHFSLHDDRLDISLCITNQGAESLPFGLGWHPFFPLSETTRLQAKASGYWQEDAQWLAGKHHHALPAGLDFNTPQPLPRHWVNNGFSGGDGKAEIVWPGSGHQLSLTTSPECPVFFLFISDSRFDEGCQHDFFCFEPMTHAPNDHHLPHGGSLRVLSPGESLTQQMSLHSATINIPE